MKLDLVPAWPWARIERFVKVFLDHHGSGPTVSAPPDMVDRPPDESGWVPWQPVDSPVTDEDVLRLEKKVGKPFPPLFRAYLMYKCLLLTDFGGRFVRLPETPSDDPLGELRGQLGIMEEEPFWRANGYVAFGQDGNDAGPVCFDTTRPTGDGDYPIVVVDHERTRSPGYAGRTKWDSFASLLDAMDAQMLSYDKGA